MSSDVFGIVGTRQAGVFRVERVVAEGGFAVVYRAMHEGFRSPVALKCLKVPDAMTAEQRAMFLEKFREEGELLFRLSALVPAVVRPLHVDIITLEGGRVMPFLALEWLEGETLDRVVDLRHENGEPPMPLDALVALLRPAAAALMQAHRLPIEDDQKIAVIHRDLKPENLFVVRAQGATTIKILDFGIARTKSAATLHAGGATQSASLDAFTPGYAAPEQWVPKRYGQVGPWTDVFSLALTMVEVLAGRPVVEGDLAAMMGTTNDPTRRPTPRTEGVAVSDAVEAVFTRALAVDPRERTQSIHAFWSELEAANDAGRDAASAPPSSPSSPTSSTSLPPRAPASAVTLDAPQPPTPPSIPPLEHPPTPPSIPPLEHPSTSRNAAAPPQPPAPQRPTPPRPPAPRPPAPQPPAPRVPTPPRPPHAAPRSFDVAHSARAPRPRMLPATTFHPDRSVDLRAMLRLPLKLVTIAVVLSVADWTYTRFMGDLFQLGIVRPVWVAGPLALLGVSIACWRILRAQ